jgi:ABC-type nickel/cobalt efflux system permease component RcnA
LAGGGEKGEVFVLGGIEKIERKRAKAAGRIEGYQQSHSHNKLSHNCCHHHHSHNNQNKNKRGWDLKVIGKLFFPAGRQPFPVPLYFCYCSWSW